MGQDFRARLRRRDKLLGTMVTLPTPATAEILADLGFDWLFVDGEHGPLETRELAGILQAVSRDVACLVRVPEASEVPIKKALDLGAAGIIVPQVNTAEQAADVVRFARYSPEGARGVGLARAHGYGMRFKEYVDGANAEIAVVVQAEHARAVDNIEAIVRVPGVDAVLLGPYDLAASLGKMGKVDDPAVVDAIRRVTDVCVAAGMPLGYFGVTAAAVKPYVERGYTLIVAGVDTLFLGQAARTLLADLRAVSDAGGV
jgi:2-keto-3-deoxy-L-rhamnonate aldolase RhmA